MTKIFYTPLFGTKKQRGSLAFWRKEHPEQVHESRTLIINRFIKEYRHNGCCKRCGYNEYTEILEFHHLDPSIKEFTVSQWHIGKGIKSLKQVKQEVEK